MTLSDLEWLSKMFNDTKHRAVSLQELSFLSCNVVKLKKITKLQANKHRCKETETGDQKWYLASCLWALIIIYVVNN